VRTTGLTELQRAFVAEYRGEGDGARAARAAGYQGNDKTVSVAVARLLKHPLVLEALEARRAERAAQAAAQPPEATRTTGTATERLELLMALARDPEVHPRDRVKAIATAAQLAGELGRGRYDLPAAPVVPATTPPPDTGPVVPSAAPAPVVKIPSRLFSPEESSG
jgi:hypothetical protein